MNITVLYFASIREAVGVSKQTVSTQAPTVNALRAELMSQSEALRSALDPKRSVKVALDQVALHPTQLDQSDLLHEGAEVAFFPPVTGG